MPIASALAISSGPPRWSALGLGVRVRVRVGVRVRVRARARARVERQRSRLPGGGGATAFTWLGLGLGVRTASTCTLPGLTTRPQRYLERHLVRHPARSSTTPYSWREDNARREGCRSGLGHGLRGGRRAARSQLGLQLLHLRQVLPHARIGRSQLEALT
eukprot:scaffold50091_cov54-Phaeocystis_antarctica.AAC.2